MIKTGGVGLLTGPFCIQKKRGNQIDRPDFLLMNLCYT